VPEAGEKGAIHACSCKDCVFGAVQRLGRKTRNCFLVYYGGLEGVSLWRLDDVDDLAACAPQFTFSHPQTTAKHRAGKGNR